MTDIRSLWRCEGKVYSGDEYSFTRVNVLYEEYKITKETAKGWWVELNYSWPIKLKWVSKTGKKRFAYPSKEEAVYSFKRRKMMQIEILKYNLKNAELLLTEVNCGKL